MLFNSYIFIFLFLPLSLIFFKISDSFRGIHGKTLCLFFISLLFYVLGENSSLPLLLLSIIINYSGAQWILLSKPKKYYCLSVFSFLIVLNLGTLFY